MAKAHIFADNFDDNTIDSPWYGAYGNPGPVEERIRAANGRLEIQPASGATGYSGVEAYGYYDMTASAVWVELVRALTPRVSGVETFLRVRKDRDEDHVEIRISAGMISCGTRLANQYTYFDDQRYDPDKHRWLQLRETNGTTYWEASPDGYDWTVLASRPNPIDMSVVDFEIGAGTSTAVAAPGMAIFDNFNTRSHCADDRRLRALGIRIDAAQLAAARRHDKHVNNNDEESFPTFVGNYSKSLKHDAVGDPDPASYATLLRALASGNPADFEQIQLASPTALKLTNPQAGFTFEISGPDPQEIAQPPAPRFTQRAGSARDG